MVTERGWGVIRARIIVGSGYDADGMSDDAGWDVYIYGSGGGTVSTMTWHDGDFIQQAYL